MEKKCLSITNGVAEVRPNVSFYVKVTNFTNIPKLLQRNEKVRWNYSTSAGTGSVQETIYKLHMLVTPTNLDTINQTIFEGKEDNPIERKEAK